MFKPNYLCHILSKCLFSCRRSRSLLKIRHRNIENTDLGRKLLHSRWLNYDMKKPHNISHYFKQEIPFTINEHVRHVNILNYTNSEPMLISTMYNPVRKDPKKEVALKETGEGFLPPTNEEITSGVEEGEQFLPIDKNEVALYNDLQSFEEEKFLPITEYSDKSFSSKIHDDYKSPQSLLDSNEITKRRYIENDYYESNRDIPENKNEEIIYVEEGEEANVPTNRYNTDINKRNRKTPYVDSSQGNTLEITEYDEENLTPENADDGVITVYEDENGNTFISKNINESDEIDDKNYIPELRYISLNKDDDSCDFIPIRSDPKKEVARKESGEWFLPSTNKEIMSREEEGEEFLPKDRHEVANYSVNDSQNLEGEEFLPIIKYNYEGYSPTIHDDYKTSQSLLESNKITKNDDYYDKRIIPENENKDIFYVEVDEEENVPANRFIDINKITADDEENVTREIADDGVITVYEDENGNTFISNNINENDKMDDENYKSKIRYISLNKEDDDDDSISARSEDIISTRYVPKNSNQAYDETYENKRFIRLHPVIGSHQ